MKHPGWKQAKLFATKPEPPMAVWPEEIASEVIGSLAELLLARARDHENASLQPRGSDDPENHT
jgi:hypothetical protein